jgi:hypothetical protein
VASVLSCTLLYFVGSTVRCALHLYGVWFGWLAALARRSDGWRLRRRPLPSPTAVAQAMAMILFFRCGDL